MACCLEPFCGLLKLGPPARCPVTVSLGEDSPTKIDYRKKGTLIRTSLLENLVKFHANL